MKRRCDVPEDFEIILNKLNNSKKGFITFSDVRSLCEYPDYNNQRKWAAYRLKELIKENKIKKTRRGVYEKYRN